MRRDPAGTQTHLAEMSCRITSYNVCYTKLLRLCFSSNYVLYGDLSQRVMTVLEGLSPSVEIYSIDEAFLESYNFV